MFLEQSMNLDPRWKKKKSEKFYVHIALIQFFRCKFRYSFFLSFNKHLKQELEIKTKEAKKLDITLNSHFRLLEEKSMLVLFFCMLKLYLEVNYKKYNYILKRNQKA